MNRIRLGKNGSRQVIELTPEEEFAHNNRPPQEEIIDQVEQRLRDLEAKNIELTTRLADLERTRP
jgi:hypothetical protein